MLDHDIKQGDRLIQKRSYGDVLVRVLFTDERFMREGGPMVAYTGIPSQAQLCDLRWPSPEELEE